jgi:hypothetical protein
MTLYETIVPPKPRPVTLLGAVGNAVQPKKKRFY